MSDFQKDSLSLEETNKVRISLGLKPLQPDSDDEGEKAKVDDDDPLKNQDEKAAKNYAQYQGDLKRKKEEEEIRERIARAQNKRELNRRLRGPTLGEAVESQSTAANGETSKDTFKWVKAAKKKAKENAAKRLKEEAEAEQLAAAESAKYDSEDLAGLRVAHDVDEIDLEAGGEGRVLTLKDSKILDGGDDELLDSALETAEKDRINAERKKGIKKYTGLDDEEFGADQIGRKRNVLSKYDNDIKEGGVKRDDGGFTLGGQGMSKAEREEAKKRQSEQILNRTLLDLDYTKNIEVSDYLQEGDVGFKKPKSKKKKRAPVRVRLEDDDESGPSSSTAVNGDVDMAEVPSSNSIAVVASERNPASEAVIDDDDLALSLAKSRREKAKKVYKKMTPEMIAKNLAAQREADEAERLATVNGTASMTEGSPIAGEERPSGSVKAEQEENSGGLIFDDTSEFVRNINEARQTSPESAARLQRRAAAEAARRQREAQEAAANAMSHQVKQESASPTVATNEVDADMLLQRETTLKEEESDEEMVDGDFTSNDAIGQEENEDSKASEPLVSGGMAATMSLLRQQGLITEITPEQRERERKQKEYDAWLATRRFEDRVREAELAASKAQGSAKDQATREYENRMRELEDARRAQDKFKNYAPDIEIKYLDEFGRTLTHHESWKRLSHVFHGKLPGQKKQEQRIQRIMDERKREKMLAGDTPSGMTKAFAERAERSGQAHMVLGVGSKNNAPQDIGLLGPNTVSRPKDKGKGKEKSKMATSNGGGTSSAMSSNGFESGLESSITGITSMVPRSTTTKSKAGFAPVKNSAASSSLKQEVPASPTSDTQTPPPSKFKLAFNKRPASDQTSMAPPPPSKHVKMEVNE